MLFPQRLTRASVENVVVRQLFYMEGLNCSGCVRLILLHLEHIVGVYSSQVNLVLGSVTVTYDSRLLSDIELLAEFKKLGFQNPTLSTNAISTLYNSKWNAQGFFLSSVSSSQFTKSGKALPYNVCFSPLSSTPQNPAIVNCRTEEDANADSGYSATTDWLYENSDDDVEPDYTTFDAAATAAAASPSSFNVTNDASSPPGASHYLDVMLWKNQNIIIPSHIKKEVDAFCALRQGIYGVAVRDAVFIRIMYNPRVVGARAILNNLIARSCDIKHCHSLGVAPSASSTSIDVEPFSSGRRSLNSRNRLLIRKREALSDLRTAFGGVLLTMSFLFIPIFRTYFGHQGCELTRGLIGTATLVKAGRYYRNLFYRYARQWKNGTQEWPCSVDCWLWPALWIIFLLPLVVTQAVYLILNIGMSGQSVHRSGLFLPQQHSPSSKLTTFSRTDHLRIIPGGPNTSTMLVVLTTFLFGRYMLYKMRQSAAGNAACVVASHDRHTRTGSFFPKNGNVYRLLLNPTKTFCSGAEQYTKAFVVDQASPSASETEQTTHWMTAIFQEKGKPLEEDSVELHEQLLHIGDVIVVKQNQCFPCDGFMLRTTKETNPVFGVAQNSFSGFLGSQQSALALTPGDYVFSGTVNLGEPVVFKTVNVGGETTLCQLRRLFRYAKKQKLKRSLVAASSLGSNERNLWHRLALLTVLVWVLTSLTYIGVMLYRGYERETLAQTSDNATSVFDAVFSYIRWSDVLVYMLLNCSQCLLSIFSPNLGLAVPVAFCFAHHLCSLHQIVVRTPEQSLKLLAASNRFIVEKTGILSTGHLDLCNAVVVPKSFFKTGLAAVTSRKGFQPPSVNSSEKPKCVETPEKETPLQMDGVTSSSSSKATEHFHAAKREKPLSAKAPPYVTHEDRFAKRLGIFASFFAHRNRQNKRSKQSDDVCPTVAEYCSKSNNSKVNVLTLPLLTPHSNPYNSFYEQHENPHKNSSQSSRSAPSRVAAPQALSSSDRLRSLARNCLPLLSLSCVKKNSKDKLSLSHRTPVSEHQRLPAKTSSMDFAFSSTSLSTESVLPSFGDSNLLQLEKNHVRQSNGISANTSVLAPHCCVDTKLPPRRTERSDLARSHHNCEVRPPDLSLASPDVGWILRPSGIDSIYDLNAELPDTSHAFNLVSNYVMRHSITTGERRITDKPAAINRMRSPSTYNDILATFWWIAWSAFSVHPNPAYKALSVRLEPCAEVKRPSLPTDVVMGIDGDVVCEIEGFHVNLSVLTAPLNENIHCAQRGRSWHGNTFCRRYSGLPAAAGSPLAPTCYDSDDESLRRSSTFDASGGYKPSSLSYDLSGYGRKTDGDLSTLFRRSSLCYRRTSFPNSLYAPVLSNRIYPRLGPYDSSDDSETIGEQALDYQRNQLGGSSRLPFLLSPSSSYLELCGADETQTPRNQRFVDSPNAWETLQKETAVQNRLCAPSLTSSLYVEKAKSPRLSRLHQVFQASRDLRREFLRHDAIQNFLGTFDETSLPSFLETANTAIPFVASSADSLSQGQRTTTLLSSDSVLSSTFPMHSTVQNDETSPLYPNQKTNLKRFSVFNVHSSQTFREDAVNSSPVTTGSNEAFSVENRERLNLRSKLRYLEGKKSAVSFVRSRWKQPSFSILDVLEAQQLLTQGLPHGDANQAELFNRLRLTPKEVSECLCFCQIPCRCRVAPIRSTGVAFGSESLSIAVAVNTPYFSTIERWNQELVAAGYQVVCVQVNNVCVGAVAFKDRLRPNALRMVKLLQRLAAPHCDVWLCTSDDFFATQETVRNAGIPLSRVVTDAGSKDKLNLLLRLQQEEQEDDKRGTQRQRSSSIVCYIGSQISDSLACSAADVSIGLLLDGYPPCADGYSNSLMTNADILCYSSSTALRNVEWLFSLASNLNRVVERNIAISILTPIAVWLIVSAAAHLYDPQRFLTTWFFDERRHCLVNLASSFISFLCLLISTDSLSKPQRVSCDKDQAVYTAASC